MTKQTLQAAPSGRRGTGWEMYRPFSGWAEAPLDIQRPLEQAVTADVIVVGGGYVGLHCALELKARGADVILIEREFCGWGASGRNGGYLVGAQNSDFAFAKRVGPDHAQRIIDFYQHAVTYVEGKLNEYGIECDYTATGTIKAGVHRSQEAKLRQLVKIAAGYGIPAHFLDHDAMRARGIPPAFLFGFWTDKGGTLNPGKYVLGLRHAALRAGVRIYENTGLLSHSEGKVVRCQTALGRAEAPHMVLATNGWTQQLGHLKDRTTTVRASLIETEPLSPALMREVGWPGREGLLTAHNILEDYNLTARNTIVAGVQMSAVLGSNMPNTSNEAAYRALQAMLVNRLPALRDQPIRACWSGYLSYADDGISVIGEMGETNNILYAAGCSGRGVAAHSLIGQLFAQKISGIENPHLTALRHDTPKVPREPFRWAKMTAMLGAARILDGQLNRAVRKRLPD